MWVKEITELGQDCDAIYVLVEPPIFLSPSATQCLPFTASQINRRNTICLTEER